MSLFQQVREKKKKNTTHLYTLERYSRDAGFLQVYSNALQIHTGGNGKTLEEAGDIVCYVPAPPVHVLVGGSQPRGSLSQTHTAHAYTREALGPTPSNGEKQTEGRNVSA